MFVIKRFRLCGALIHFHLFVVKINQKSMVAGNIINYRKFICCNLRNFDKCQTSHLHCVCLNINKMLISGLIIKIVLHKKELTLY